MTDSILYNSFIFLIAACIAVPLASRFKLGAVLGYLIAGVLIGPFGIRLIGNPDEIMHFAEFGIVMMLFLIGLELKPTTLWQSRRAIIGLGSSQVIVTSLILMGIGMALGFSWQASLACGMALSLSSTAIVLQILQEKGLLHTAFGDAAFSTLLLQDIAVIPILVILPLLAGTDTKNSNSGLLSNLPAWLHALAVLVIICCIIIAGRFLSNYLFRFIAKTKLREIFTATSLALVIGVTLLMEILGISAALGAFIAGVVLANSEYKHTLESDIEPFKGLLLGLFFISIGMSMNFALLAKEPEYIFTAVLGLLLIKALILWLLGRIFGLRSSQNIGFALALCQGGEFAFVLFQIISSLHLIQTEQAAFLTLTVAISMALTPLLLLIYSQIILPYFTQKRPTVPYDHVTENENPIIIAGYGRVGQIIGRFLSAQGIPLTILENDPDQIDLLRRFGSKAYFGDAARLDLLQSAGAAQAKLLVIAIDDTDKALAITQMAKHEFPHLKILARARNRRHAYELYKAGADYFRRETFDSALMIAKEVMRILNFSAAEVHDKAQQFVEHDEKTLQKSFAFFEKEPELISFSRQANQELERILQNDIK